MQGTVIKPIRLFLLIRSLGHGGAERQLTELVKRLDRTRFEITVATFYDGGQLRAEIEGIEGIRVLSAGKKGRWDVFPTLWRLSCAIREARPHIIHGYLGIANELSLLFGRIAGARVVWGMRMSKMEETRKDWLSELSFRAGAWLSSLTDLMIANSHVGQKDYAAAGYSTERMTVISNGIDTARFCSDDTARIRVRRAWGVSEDQQLIGIVGRLNPQKDHETYLRAAAILNGHRQKLRFVCVGDGPEEYREHLERLASSMGLDDRVIWVRASNDMPGVYNALDLLVLPSAYGEGFPNVVGEAMACCTPVVTTDVGDSAMIVGDESQVVPPKNPEALAGAIDRILNLAECDRIALGNAERERIVAEFSVEHLTKRTMTALEGII